MVAHAQLVHRQHFVADHVHVEDVVVRDGEYVPRLLDVLQGPSEVLEHGVHGQHADVLLPRDARKPPKALRGAPGRPLEVLERLLDELPPPSPLTTVTGLRTTSPPLFFLL
jgi:hypothetical protein